MRIARILVVVVLSVLLLPYLLTPLYSVGHPVSTLMAWRWLKGAPVARQWIDFKAIAPSLEARTMTSPSSVSTHLRLNTRPVSVPP